MKIKFNSYKVLGAVSGILFGFGALIAAVVIRALFIDNKSLATLESQVVSHLPFYNYISLIMLAVFGSFGFCLGWLAEQIFSLKTSLEHVNVFLKEVSMTDDITRQYNHRHILVEAEKEIERATRYRHTLSGMMVDIDDFKKVNDTYGHLTGDDVLKEVAVVLDESIRRIDILGRFGGDEFMIILPESSADTARFVAERIQKSIQKHEFKDKNHTFPVTLSIGVFFFGNLEGVDRNMFVERADQALLKAKGLGKNRIFFET